MAGNNKVFYDIVSIVNSCGFSRLVSKNWLVLRIFFTSYDPGVDMEYQSLDLHALIFETSLTIYFFKPNFSSPKKPRWCANGLPVFF